MQFVDLNLKVGSRLLLQAQGQDYKRHTCEGRLLGYRPEGSIILSIVKKPPQVLLQDGLGVDVRVAVPSGLVDFTSSILCAMELPYRHWHLQFPTEVKLKPLRSEARYRFDAAFSAVAHTSLGLRLEDIKGVICDISLRGARIALNKKLGEIVTGVAIKCPVVVAGVAQEFSVDVSIKRDFGGDGEMAEYPYVYGVLFADVAPAQQMLLMALCYELSSETATDFF